MNAVVRVECLEEGFNSYRKLIRVVCWIKRLGFFIKIKVKNRSVNLTTAEAQPVKHW